MSRKGKLSSLLMQKEPDQKKIAEYGRSRKLDIDELFGISITYLGMVQKVPNLNPLHVACISSKPNVVSALIQEGYDLNAVIGNVDSYLCIALHNGNTSVVRLLLELGSDAHSFNSQGMTPIVDAFIKYKKEKVCVSNLRLLIEAGVRVDRSLCMHSQEKPLHLAVKKNSALAVNFLLEKGADGNVTDRIGNTPLHLACARNLVGIIKLLIQHNVSLDVENKAMHTPLMIVVSAYFKEALTILISGGCDINQVMFHGSLSALHIAVGECDLEKVMDVVSLGADPNLKLPNGKTPLHELSARAENVTKEIFVQTSIKILEFLVGKGANVNVTDNTKCTPLLYAISSKQYSLAEQFIKLGAHVNYDINSSGYLLFHNHDLSHLNHNISTLMLEYGADYNKRDKAGFTPYHYATRGEGNVKLIKCYVRFGCPYNQRINGSIFLYTDCAQELNQFFKAEAQFFKGLKKNNLKLVQKAVEDGAVPTGCSETCRYPLHFLASKGYKELLKYLLENGFPVNTLNDEGQTALFVGAKQGNYKIVRILLQYGASFNGFSKKCSIGVPPQFESTSIMHLLKKMDEMFHLASEGDKIVILELRVALSISYSEYKMYANAINVKGETLMSTALRFYHSDIAYEMMKLRIFAFMINH